MKGITVQMIALDAIEPNPYRHIEKYPVNREKVAALMQSYGTSGFWNGSIQARPHPTKPGTFQVAFGHHRVIAARELAETDAQFKTLGLVISKRSDADMLRMMADENRAEFKHDMAVTIETISAVIDAYAAGEITLEAVSAKPNTPEFHLPGGKCYSLATVARFLGWVKPSDGQATRGCREAFDAYRELASTGEALQLFSPEERTSTAVETVTTAARSARTQAQKDHATPSQVRKAEQSAAVEAVKEIKKTTASQAQDQAVAIGKKAAATVVGKKPKKQPHVELYIKQLVAKIGKISPFGPILTEARRLVPFIDDIPKAARQDAATALRDMAKRSNKSVESLASALELGNSTRMRALLEAGK